MYNLKLELHKIQEAFKRVKKDQEHALERIKQLEKENSKLHTLIVNKKNEIKTIIKEENTVLIGNKDSKKVHTQDCPYGKKVSLENREIFDTVQDALKQKYKRCSCLK